MHNAFCHDWSFTVKTIRAFSFMQCSDRAHFLSSTGVTSVGLSFRCCNIDCVVVSRWLHPSAMLIALQRLANHVAISQLLCNCLLVSYLASYLRCFFQFACAWHCAARAIARSTVHPHHHSIAGYHLPHRSIVNNHHSELQVVLTCCTRSEEVLGNAVPQRNPEFACLPITCCSTTIAHLSPSGIVYFNKVGARIQITASLHGQHPM